MNWFKKMFSKKPSVIDASDLISVNYSLYVNSEGKLTLNCYGLSYRIVGIIAWDNKTKQIFNVDKNETVLDMLTLQKSKELK